MAIKFRIDKAPVPLYHGSMAENALASWLEDMAKVGWELVMSYEVGNSPYTSDGTSPRFVFRREVDE